MDHRVLVIRLERMSRNFTARGKKGTLGVFKNPNNVVGESRGCPLKRGNVKGNERKNSYRKKRISKEGALSRRLTFFGSFGGGGEGYWLKKRLYESKWEGKISRE